MSKYTLLVENEMFPIKNIPMFILFVIGVTIGASFALIYYDQTIVFSQPHQLHFDRLNYLEENDSLHAVSNESNGKNAQNNDNVHLIENQTLVTSLYNEVRVLCWIMTTPKNHQSRAIHVKRTWGKRCNKLIFISTAYDAKLDTVVLNYTNDRPNRTWGKTKRAFQYIYEKHRNDADWFLKADDDTFVILENLRYFLYAYSSADPIYFGYKMQRPDILKHGYFNGGAGYVLSRNALDRFSDAIKQRLPFEASDNCRIKRDDGVEDLEMGKCMESLGVFAGDTRDEMKRGRFFLNTPEAHLIPGKIDASNWYWQTMWYHSDEGLDCCSDNAISFHRISPEQMYSFEYLVYHLKPYGVISYPQPLPRKVNFSEIAAQLNDETPDSLII